MERWGRKVKSGIAYSRSEKCYLRLKLRDTHANVGELELFFQAVVDKSGTPDGLLHMRSQAHGGKINEKAEF